jgi:CubicO group peptidase (beta-lactamase class C family)
MVINGFCDERFLPLKHAFRANFDAGLELGASLALAHRGKIVVDLWGGFADSAKTTPWREDTITIVYSTTKIMATIATLMVVDRGQLELDAPIARYWPEFAQGGKENVMVRDALTFQAGVPGFDPPVSFESVHDWDATVARIAAMPHWFDGERRICYHPTTYGFLLGELVRRVDGRPMAQFFREEIAQKLHADFQIGLSSKDDLSRLAVHQFLKAPAPLEGFRAKVMDSVAAGNWWTWERLSADIPAASGMGNGRSIAKVCSIIALGGDVDGTLFMSRRMADEAAREQAVGECPCMGPVRFGLGLALHSDFFPAPSPTSIHWGGFGGSWALMDPRAGVSFGYAMNNLIVSVEDDALVMDPRLKRFSDALEKILPGL